jgi:hypothetical protein
MNVPVQSTNAANTQKSIQNDKEKSFQEKHFQDNYILNGYFLRGNSAVSATERGLLLFSCSHCHTRGEKWFCKCVWWSAAGWRVRSYQGALAAVAISAVRPSVADIGLEKQQFPPASAAGN